MKPLIPITTSRHLRRALVITLGLGTLASSANAQAVRCFITGLDRATYLRNLHQAFSTLMGSQANVPGTFASLDVKDANATFASSIALGRGDVISVKAMGGYNDGVLAIISDETVSPKFGGEVQYNALSAAANALEFNSLSCVSYYAAVQKAEDEFALRDIETRNNFRATLQRSAIAALDARIKKLTGELGNASGYAIDSLNVELLKTQAQRTVLSSDPLPSPAQLRYSSSLQRADDLAAAQSLLKLTGFAFGWWSLRYRVDNSVFRLFNPSLAVSDQLKKTHYTTHSVEAAYSHYHVTAAPNETHFWSIAGSFSREDNEGKLTKVDITERKTYNAAPDERVAESKVTGLQGAYEKDLNSLRLGVEDFRFFFVNNQAALHTFTAIKAKDQSAPTYSLGAGLLMTARKDPLKESYLNAEIYYELTDLTNSSDSDSGLFGRSDLGLRFTFPISFTPRP